MPSWDSEEADELWTESCGKDRWVGTTEVLEQHIRRISDDRLWQLRNTACRSLIEYTRERLSLQLTVSGASPGEIADAKQLFDPKALTLGFARRFATYKRPNLLLHDPERLLRILTNPHRPVQLILAGKAHPADEAGQAISDYDMLLTERLVQGVDVWINTPRRPWEACGTSGMKVLVNGGINLSELDGWWVEAYTPEVGWALGDGQERGDDPAWDAAEAEAFYNLLEQEVIPEFYTRNENDIPSAWITRVRESMSLLTPRFSANRMVREYTENHYLPAAAAYRERSADKGAKGKQLTDWRLGLESKWAELRFGETKSVTREEHHVFEVQLYLGNLDPDTVSVELYADGIDGSGPVRHKMIRGQRLEGSEGGYIYSFRVSAARPITDYTARVIPCHPEASVPLEVDRILWQR
jgi:starch phosphorylase